MQLSGTLPKRMQLCVESGITPSIQSHRLQGRADSVATCGTQERQALLKSRREVLILAGDLDWAAVEAKGVVLRFRVREIFNPVAAHACSEHLLVHDLDSAEEAGIAGVGVCAEQGIRAERSHVAELPSPPQVLPIVTADINRRQW